MPVPIFRVRSLAILNLRGFPVDLGWQDLFSRLRYPHLMRFTRKKKKPQKGLNDLKCANDKMLNSGWPSSPLPATQSL